MTLKILVLFLTQLGSINFNTNEVKIILILKYFFAYTLRAVGCWTCCLLARFSFMLSNTNVVLFVACSETGSLAMMQRS